jgi:hypothetical protein
MTEAQMQALIAREKKLEEDFRPIMARIAAVTEARTKQRVEENKKYFDEFKAEKAAKAAEVAAKHAEYVAKPKRSRTKTKPYE